MSTKKPFNATKTAREWLRKGVLRKTFLRGTVEPCPHLNLRMVDSVARLLGKGYRKGRADEKEARNQPRPLVTYGH